MPDFGDEIGDSVKRTLTDLARELKNFIRNEAASRKAAKANAARDQLEQQYRDELQQQIHELQNLLGGTQSVADEFSDVARKSLEHSGDGSFDLHDGARLHQKDAVATLEVDLSDNGLPDIDAAVAKYREYLDLTDMAGKYEMSVSADGIATIVFSMHDKELMLDALETAEMKIADDIAYEQMQAASPALAEKARISSRSFDCELACSKEMRSIPLSLYARSSEELKESMGLIHDELESHGLHPEISALDNGGFRLELPNIGEAEQAIDAIDVKIKSLNANRAIEENSVSKAKIAEKQASRRGFGMKESFADKSARVKEAVRQGARAPEHMRREVAQKSRDLVEESKKLAGGAR